MKKILGSLLILVTLSLVGWMIYASVKTLNKKEALIDSISQVPKFSLQLPDSASISIWRDFTESPLLLIYFNSECEYCNAEAKEIVEKQEQLEGIEMIFISLEPFHKIKQFGDSIGLTHLPNVLLGKIDEQTADEILGITSAPQLFIYNKEGQLTKQFKGSTKIEAIIKYANQE
jgi:thioredoxin-related protein